jgi:hypothetical protein
MENKIKTPVFVTTEKNIIELVGAPSNTTDALMRKGNATSLNNKPISIKVIAVCNVL